MFKKAVKYGAKLRMALAGPAGAGKTWTALTLATALADGGSIALIDTERGSASKYADVFQFDVMELDSFHPDKFVAGIHEAEQAGYAVLIIDSLSHAWNGSGGLLELVEQITKRSNSKNSFNAWGEATPIHNRLIDAITRSSLHIIATMRSKTEYVVEMGSNGKTAPRKVGTAPIQRDGFEYEFDVFADLDIENTLIVQKSRCPALSGAVIAKPDAKVSATLKSWLDGAPAPVVEVPQPQATDQQKASIRKLYEHLGRAVVEEDIAAMTYRQAKDAILVLSGEYNKTREKPAPAPVVETEQANGHHDLPTIKELQSRCKSLFGAGKWQAVVLKALKVEDPDLTIQEDDLTPDDRERIAAYLDFAESKKASAGAGK